jgi:hypothetical protein
METHPQLQFINTYILQAYRNAGISEPGWQPEKGYRANAAIMDRVYIYYQQLYRQSPVHFLWAGLARLTGGQVMYVMQNICRIAKDPCVLTQNITAVAKSIFERMAWQHELFVADVPALLHACSLLDEYAPAVHRYKDCWETILQNTPEAISQGNKMLLENEQHNTIQPYYDLIKKDKYSAKYFRFTRLVMRQIHPYHRRFILHQPFGDVTVFADRWRWIDGPKGMWHTWCSIAPEERARLVDLTNQQVIRHQW